MADQPENDPLPAETAPARDESSISIPTESSRAVAESEAHPS
ncbi:hypothetical protein [Sphingomonas sp. BK235]|nr:hypothetical protein [Sphingomonas sp. BK235]TCP36995.1 hypothetical protein EV292_101501 [Sphingomonas sp. BK235]